MKTKEYAPRTRWAFTMDGDPMLVSEHCCGGLPVVCGRLQKIQYCVLAKYVYGGSLAGASEQQARTGLCHRQIPFIHRAAARLWWPPCASASKFSLLLLGVLCVLAEVMAGRQG